MLLFFVLAIAICGGVLFWYTRCWRSTTLVVVCSLVAVLWQCGLLATFHYELDPYSILVPFLVFAIGMSHGAQKMNGIMQDVGRGTHRVVAARYTFRRLFAAGLTALLCDAVFMAESATIVDPHVRVGIVAGDGGTVAWPAAMGPMKAKRYLLTGDAVSAAEAERLGLITEVVPDGEAGGAALAFARRLAAGAPLAVQYTKLAVNKLIKDALGVSFDAATGYEMVTMLSEDHDEAIEAFKGKRAPEFEGR